MKSLYALVFTALVACSSANDAPASTVPPTVDGVIPVDTSDAMTIEAPAGATVQWSSAAWRKPKPPSTGTPPAAGNDVTVAAGQRLILDTDTTVRNIKIYGTLEFANKDLNLSAASIMVEAGGKFQIGSELMPYTKKAVVTLTGSNAKLDVMGMGTKFLGAMGGTIALHGKPNVRAWSKLAQNAAKGTTSLQVLEPIGWAVGDSIVLASGTGEPNEAETNTITAISGSSITLATPLKNARAARVVTVAGRTLDMRPEVGLLSRNILVQGDATSSASGFGGHIMVMAGSKAQIDGVELRQMGQTNRVGRYPFHWHLIGDASGQYIKNSVVNSSLQRGIVLHGTQNALVQNNIVYNSLGHNYSIEDSSAIGNTLSGNLAVVNRIAVFTAGELKSQGDNQAANYWTRAARNTFTDNVAAGNESFGFWYDGVTDGPTTFARNVAHSNIPRPTKVDFIRGSGLTVIGPDDATTPLEFKDSLFYNNATGVWPADGYQNYTNLTFADQYGHSMVAEGMVGTVKDSLFVYDTGSNAQGHGAVHMQYGATVNLEHPIFANYGTRGVLSTTDIFVPMQADFTLSNPEFINTAPLEQQFPEERFVVELKDSLMQPKGFYVPTDYPQLVGPNAKRVTLGITEPSTYLQTPNRFRSAALMIRKGLTPSGVYTGTIRRSDGLRYGQANLPTFVLYDTDLTYQLETAPTGAFILSLETFATSLIGTPSAQVATPLTQAPKLVYTVGKDHDGDPLPDPATPSDQLQSASSLAEFQASPLTKFYYDVTAKLLYTRVTERWLVVRP